MALYYDGPATISLNKANQTGLNTSKNEDLFDSSGMSGTMQQVLSENLGRFVLVDFLAGVQTIMRKGGILYSVGRSYLVLYDEAYSNFTLCDMFAVKFVTFFPTGRRPDLSGSGTSGILRPGLGGILDPSGGPTSGILYPDVKYLDDQGRPITPPPNPTQGNMDMSSFQTAMNMPSPSGGNPIPNTMPNQSACRTMTPGW